MAGELAVKFDSAGDKLRRKVWACGLSACLRHPSVLPLMGDLLGEVVEVFVGIVTELGEDAKDGRSPRGR